MSTWRPHFVEKEKRSRRFVFFPDAAPAIIRDWTTLSARLFACPFVRSLLLPIFCLAMPKQENYPLALTETAHRPRTWKLLWRLLIASQFLGIPCSLFICAITLQRISELSKIFVGDIMNCYLFAIYYIIIDTFEYLFLFLSRYINEIYLSL